MTDIKTDLILEEIRKSKQELKLAIDAVEVRITLKIEDVNRKLNYLEQENKEIINKIEKLERKQKENNIVIFGLQTSNQITLEFIRDELKRLVDVDITEFDINNFYTLGNGENRPVKVEFVSYIKKALIFKNKTKLKGSKIFISNDLTDKQRKDNNILRKHLHLARNNNNENCYIKRNQLYVNNQPYTVNELENLEDIQDSDQPKATSAPGTPTQGNTETAQEIKKLTKPLEKPIPRHLNTPPSSFTEKNQSKEYKSMKDPKMRTRSTSKDQNNR